MASALSQACAAPGVAAVRPAGAASQDRGAVCRVALAPAGLVGARLGSLASSARFPSTRAGRAGRPMSGIRALAAGFHQDGAAPANPSKCKEQTRVAVLYVAVRAAVQRAAEVLRHFLLTTQLPRPRNAEEAAIVASLKGSLLLTAGPLFFASQSVSTPVTVVASGMAKWLELYSGVLMIRVLLSWFPNIPWERQPLQAMRDMCDPYLNLFRNIIPPVFNALDLSPMLAFLVLGTLTSILNTTVQG